MFEEIYSNDAELNIGYNTSDLEKCNFDLRCNPVQPSSSEKRKDKKKNLWDAKKSNLLLTQSNLSRQGIEEV